MKHALLCHENMKPFSLNNIFNIYCIDSDLMKKFKSSKIYLLGKTTNNIPFHSQAVHSIDLSVYRCFLNEFN